MIRMKRRVEIQVTVRPSVCTSCNLSKNWDIFIMFSGTVTLFLLQMGVIGQLPRPQNAIDQKQINYYN